MSEDPDRLTSVKFSRTDDEIAKALSEEHGLEPEQFILPIQFNTPARQTARVRPSHPPRSPAMRIEILQSNRVLRQHNHDGRSYIEAPPEGEYTIRLTNTRRRARSPEAPTERQLAVVSVDGLNIITGEKAGFTDPGYVVLPGQSIDIPGWRRTDSEVAAFQFKPQEGSYTAQMGNGTSNTGVIGVAVFNEKHVPVLRDRFVGLGATSTPRRRVTTTTTTTIEESVNDRINARARSKGLNPDGRLGGKLGLESLSREIEDGFDDGIDDGSMHVASGAAAACSADDGYTSVRTPISDTGTTYGASFDGSPLRGVQRRRRKAPELGTGYGGRQTMHTAETTFERATEVPFQVLTLQYAVRAKLIEWGVPLPELPPMPSAFPAAGHSVQAPPGWRG